MPDCINDLRYIRDLLKMSRAEFRAWYEDRYQKPFDFVNPEAAQCGTAYGMLKIVIDEIEFRARMEKLGVEL